MSSAAPITALAPKRTRGRLRVAAILEAATDVFAERGFEAATMTEIAARSNTAIGSLYRFFPTKEVLAQALLSRYGEELTAALEGLGARAAMLAPDELADALVGLVLGLSAERTVAAALVETREDASVLKSSLRDGIRRQIAGMLMACAPALPSERAPVIAAVIHLVLKLVASVAKEQASGETIAEVRGLARLYLTTALGEGTCGRGR